MHRTAILSCYVILQWFSPVYSQFEDETVLYPVVANVARKAKVETNATCGYPQREYFCRLIQGEFFNPWQSQYCYTCDSQSTYPSKSHPIENVIDGGEAWWQSPSLANGMQYDYVTVTLDLQQVYQVSYVNIQAGLSPRPGNWILEKSLDGKNFTPWQFFAITDAECWLNYGTPPVIGRPKNLRDNQVICTSYFSRIDPLQNGTVFVSMIRGRQSAFNPSQTLINFMSTRFIRLRLQKMQKLNNDEIILMMNRPDDVDGAILRRYFYTIKEISVGAQCECNGHASRCTEDPQSGEPLCECEHNTCGPTCNMCCPKYHQKPWKPAVENKEFVCEECNCNGHSSECIYNQTVARDRRSVNINNIKTGGGVCLNCRDGTEGVNCERCIMGYYRPRGSPLSAPCQPCQCNQRGSTGVCVPDDSNVEAGLFPGDCICEEEYMGGRCDKCAPGYRDYPWCEKCPCNSAGSQNSDLCKEDCICKENVEGVQCDRCQSGYYHLSEDNPSGCTPCFCFGVTNQCESLQLEKITIIDMGQWKLLTLSGRRSYVPTSGDDWLNYEGPAIYGGDETDILYWSAPLAYLGDRLYSYGGVLEYTFKYETSGYSTDTHHLAAADIILQSDELTIAKRGKYYRENVENSVEVKFTEEEWFKQHSKHSVDFNQQITKADFMTILSSVKGFLIRASYHSGQSVSQLQSVKLDAGEETGVLSDEPMKSVERCHCPQGYTGVSCQNCEEEYRRVNNTLMGGRCEPCRCHGHSMSCDPMTGRCLDCTDDTVGDNCETCRGGFYGNPTVGGSDWCKPCACPLVEASNNFAVDCKLGEDNSNYSCVGCQRGYAGHHCEGCADGFYGNPLVPGDFCQPCQCNNNIDLQAVGNCDTQTGECLKCLNNTEGFNCDQCKSGFYGAANTGDCRACLCDKFGSEEKGCEGLTGQCRCREHYTGQYCDHCEAGFGDVESGCLPCQCSDVGSHHQMCDPVTGHCDCKPGITGQSCDTCLNGFYGLSKYGCTECDCDAGGSNTTVSCDPGSGQCRCLPNVSGLTCDQCQSGFWNMSSTTGCQSCDCNTLGSWDISCDMRTGQCSCKNGVFGRTCSSCLQGYYGFSHKGCRACQACKSQYHVCESETGLCVCPPNTQGDHCQDCLPSTWAHHPINGCQDCGCHKAGSINNQCDGMTGQCVCKEDYMGLQCDQCQFGYYGFPSCRPCLCDVNGTHPESCDGLSSCQCDERGQCPCKRTVEGRQCNRCKEGHFGLRSEEKDGCSECFCFGKTNDCQQSDYVWTKVKGEERRVNLNGRSPVPVTHMFGLNILPAMATDAGVPPGGVFDPIYWSLPETFTGDQGMSYNGRLEFRVLYATPVTEVDGSSDWDEDTGTFSGSLVVLRSSGMVLQYRQDIQLQPNTENYLTVTLSENEFTGFVRFEPVRVNVTKALLMTVLANLEGVYILAAPTAYNYYVELKSVSLQTAIVAGNGEVSPLALGVELCQCPSLYSGASCQLPGSGYFRDTTRPRIDWWNLSNITIAMRPCDCNNHSQQCDPMTGHCQDCLHHTTGFRCESCVTGYYGNGDVTEPGYCQRCACPLKINSNNPTCRAYGDESLCTNCTQGTSGQHCEICLPGYYGDPTVEGHRCTPCACNLQGSRRRSCDKVTGQCDCRTGLSGRSCDQCRPRHVLIRGRCQTCDDGCPGKLMTDLDELDVDMSRLLSLNLTDLPPPFYRAEQVLNKTLHLQEKLLAMEHPDLDALVTLLQEAEDNVTALLKWTKQAIEEAGVVTNNSLDLTKAATETEDSVGYLLQDLQENVESLDELVEKLLQNVSSLNISSALPHARQLLIEIRVKIFKAFDKAANRENESAEETLKRVNGLGKSNFNMSALKESLELLRAQLLDLELHLNKSVSGELEASQLYHSNGRIYNRTEELIKWLESNLTDVNSVISDGNFLTEDGKKILTEAFSDLENAEKKLDVLRTVSEHLGVKGEVMRKGLSESEELVNLAWGHALRLLEQAVDLNSTFSGARTDAVDPLRAATVYKNIVLAVEKARAAANKAVTETDHTLAMAKDKTLENRVEESVTASGDMSNKETDIIRNISRLWEKFGDVSEGVVPVERNLNQSEEDLLLIDRQMNRLGEGFKDRLSAIDDKLPSVIEGSGEVTRRVEEKMEKMTTEILPTLVQVNPDSILNELGYNINKTVDFEKMENLTKWLSTKLNNTNHLKSTLSDKITALKDKINLARNEANNVKASLSASGNCVRSYRPPVHTGTTNNIILHFKTNNTAEDMMVLLLQNSNTEYISVELKGGKIALGWNLGGGPGRVIHPEPIENTVGENQSSERWYRVDVNRVGRVGLLKVKPLFGLSPLSEDVELSGTSPPGSSLIAFNNSSQLYIAGLPQNYQPPPGVTDRNFTGCIGEVFIESQRLGLFNFIQSSDKCYACLQPPPLSAPVSGLYQFDGTGYAALPGFAVDHPYSSNQYVVSLRFQTVWENALLLLSSDTDTGDYISLELRDGRVFFQYYMGGNSLGILVTKQPYNLNEWVTVTAGRQSLRGMLEVSEGDQSEIITGLALPGHNLLDLIDRAIYFGGVPDSVQLPRVPYISRKKRRLRSPRSDIDVELTPFRGCMRDVQVGSKRLSTVDLLQGDTVGVTEGCRTLGERIVGFLGDGYIELGGRSLSKGSAEISVTFRTSHPEGVILLATGDDTQHFYSIAVVHGLLQARINGGSGAVIFTAEQNYTDGKPHTVSLIKNKRRVELLIDESVVETGQLPVGSAEIRIPVGSGLFLGGVAPGVNTHGMVGTNKGFHGCISDVIINKRLLLLDKPLNYERADIGRCSEAALASIFDPPGVTRRPSIWPGLGTSQERPGSRVTTATKETESSLTTASQGFFPTTLPFVDGGRGGMTTIRTINASEVPGVIIPAIPRSSSSPGDTTTTTSVSDRFSPSAGVTPPGSASTKPTDQSRSTTTTHSAVDKITSSRTPLTTIRSFPPWLTSKIPDTVSSWTTTSVNLFPFPSSTQQSVTSPGQSETRSTTKDKSVSTDYPSAPSTSDYTDSERSTDSTTAGVILISGFTSQYPEDKRTDSSDKETSSSTTSRVIIPPWEVTRHPETKSSATTTAIRHTAETSPPRGTVEPYSSTTAQPDGRSESITSLVPDSSTNGTTEAGWIPIVTSKDATDPSTAPHLPEEEESGSSTQSSLSTSTDVPSTTVGYGILPVTRPGGETTVSRTDKPYFTRVPVEEVTSGDDNDTLVIIPGGEDISKTTRKPPVTDNMEMSSVTPTEPVPVIPKTIRPDQSKISRKPTTDPDILASSVSIEPSSVPFSPQSTESGIMSSSEPLTTPSILVATISVSPSATSQTTTSSTIQSSTTNRYVVVPTAEYTTTFSTPSTSIPSMTIRGVSPSSYSTATATDSTTVTTTVTTTIPTPPPTECAVGDEYTNERNSIAFGNSQFSFAEIKFRRKSVKKNFKITFAFRSYFPDGMFFYLTNRDQTHFVSGQLKGGHVVITYNDRQGSPLTISTSETYEDGLWHSVNVEKGQRDISLEVDKSVILRGGIPRRLNVTAPMYVGGLPREFQLREGLVSHSVRGCMRRFSVNGGLFHLKNASVVSGVGPCYSKVENGAFFNGDSYGVFAQKFSIGSALLFALSFKTHKKDGVLLSVSSYKGSPALTLELHEGKLKFNMRSSAGVFTAESSYDTDFALCDRRWHDVKAEVIQSVITLKVDGGPVSYAFDRASSRRIRSRHPLYIGGLPDYARPQGASFSQANFEGCMKNVFINGIPIDWFNLFHSVEINKVSCPLL